MLAPPPRTVSDTAQVNAAQVNRLPLEQIVFGAHQPRKTFDPKALEELCDSVRTWGVLQPILVRPVGVDRFEIVAGERRFLASQRTRQITIPVVIRELSEAQALEVALLENLQRADLSEIEETEGLLKLLSMRLQRTLNETVSLLYRMDNEAKDKVTVQVLGSDDGRLVEATFSAIGKLTWQSFVTTRLPLLKLPTDLLEALRAGEVSPLRARLVSRVTDATERQRVLETAILEGWSNTQLRERITQTRDPEGHGVRKVGTPILGRLRSLALALESEFAWCSASRHQQAERLVRELERLVLEDAVDGGANSQVAS